MADVVTPAAPASSPAAPAAPATSPAAPAAPAVVAPAASADPVPPAAPVVPVAPVVYALTVPAGAESFIDADDLKAFETAAKTYGWTPEEAQEEVRTRAEALQAQDTAFLARLTAHPTYGGEHLADTERLRNLGLDAIAPAGDPLGAEFRRLVLKHGFGNNLPFAAAMVRTGKLVAEDRPGAGGGGGGDPVEYKSPRDLYKNTTPTAG